MNIFIQSFIHELEKQSMSVQKAVKTFHGTIYGTSKRTPQFYMKKIILGKGKKPRSPNTSWENIVKMFQKRGIPESKITGELAKLRT